MLAARCSFFSLVLGLPLWAAVPPDAVQPAASGYAPPVAGPSKDAALATARIRVPAGFQAELFAAEPLLANPVAFCFDHLGRVFVAETYRIHDGVTDNRGHMYWLRDDLACRTVADRDAKYRKHLKNGYARYSREHDRVRLLFDSTGQGGKPDRATVFADGFRHAVDGIGSGVLAHRGKVYYTCIPDLWELEETTGRGVADRRKSLSHGYGVHTSFIGHDLHGLVFNPADGMLYFTIGDRGANVLRPDGQRVGDPDAGSVFRCNLDGSDLEVVHNGLRNPQELAFDDFGNLFTGDNNSDSGDKARLVAVVEGGESGWHLGWQYLEKPNSRGPWNSEFMWHPQRPDQPAFLLPPIANLGDGPSGMTAYPGTGLPERYRGHFFLADFRGTPHSSGIRSFALQPRGAGWELIDQHEFAWGVLATDVEFGPDSALYVLDWVEGWGKTGKGRIHRIASPELAHSPAAREVRHILRTGLSDQPTTELLRLLGHADRRIRGEAQLTLVDRGEKALQPLVELALRGSERMPRVHALWALGMLAKRHPDSLPALLPILSDPDEEVVAQAAKLLGAQRVSSAGPLLVNLLRHPHARIRFNAVMALGKLRHAAALTAVLELVRENQDQDPYLRHAGVMYLTWLGDMAAIQQAAEDASPAIRMAALLALRKLQSPVLARFLIDPEPRLVQEAARAIHDLPIPPALPALARVSLASSSPLTLAYRVVNAQFRMGDRVAAETLAGLAAQPTMPAELRTFILRLLGTWEQPDSLCPVTGLYRPLPPRGSQELVAALSPRVSGLLDGPETVVNAAIAVLKRYRIEAAGAPLATLARNRQAPAAVRAAALTASLGLPGGLDAKTLQVLLHDTEAAVRAASREAWGQLDPQQAVAWLAEAAERGEMAERQAALATLAQLPADNILSDWLDRLAAGRVPVELQLDVLEAASQRAVLKERLNAVEAELKRGSGIAPYHWALAGGDAARGRKVFFENTAVHCLRCHRVGGEGGEVGPDLTHIGRQHPRDYLLEAMVLPNAKIAQGFETVIIEDKKGLIHQGILKGEDAREVRLLTPEGKPVTIPKSQIEDRRVGQSAMPGDLVQQLSRRELRDLLEYLAGLK